MKDMINKIFSSKCEFVIGATKIEDIPVTHLSEVAFIGRSNVGKSSLINALVKQKSLARVSQNPGCTRQINFFNLGNFIYLVDLPGYGYAKISKSERKTWDQIIYSYLIGRPHLKRIFLLIDARHEFKDIDVKTMDFLDDCAVTYQIVLTKADKLERKELEDQIVKMNKLITKHAACHPEIIVTSTKKELGIDILRNAISDFISVSKPS